MHFSARTQWNTEESDLARAHRTRCEAGLPVADLTASNPTRCGFSYPTALLQALTDPAALEYDPQPRGAIHARQAVCAYYADHGAPIDLSQVILTTSTSEAYSFLFRLLCDPGDEVLILQPGYPLFDFLAALEDIRLKPVSLVYDHGWQLDPEGLRRAITPATRAIVVVHPNNPTGHFTKSWEVEELARLCREFNLALVVDEVFLDYGFAPSAWTFAAGVEGVPVFVVSGLSKIAGLPQMKAAWIVATGPDHAAALERLEVIADTFLSMNAPVQCALPAWLGMRGSMQEQIRLRANTNLQSLDQALTAVPAARRLQVEGGWYAVLRIPALQSDETTVRELLDRGVWVHPGYFFGLPAAGWLVISLITPEQEFSTGVTAMINYLGTHHASNSTGNRNQAFL